MNPEFRVSPNKLKSFVNSFKDTFSSRKFSDDQWFDTIIWILIKLWECHINFIMKTRGDNSHCVFTRKMDYRSFVISVIFALLQAWFVYM